MLRRWRDELAEFAVEGGQPHPVPLGPGERSQAAGQETSVIQLPDASPAKVHGARDIDGDDEVGVCIGLELLDVKTVGTGEESPIEPPDVVSGHVGPVFGEVDGTAQERGTMETADESLDHHLRNERQVLDPGEGHGINEPRAGGRHGWS